MRGLFSIFVPWLVAAAIARAAAAPTLLEQAVDNWLGERDNWAFTQRAVEFDDGKPRERLERYDPSKPGDGRWTLLAIDGKQPTEEQRAAWAKKKFKKNKRKFESPIGDYFDFRSATIVSETPKVVRYQVPLHREKRWLFETDKVKVVVTINKETRALEHLTANVREPVKVLLGIVKITDGALDLNFLPFDVDAPSGPDATQPKGSAHVSVSKPGGRVEFTWSDFKRVVPSGNSEKMARTGR
jgi:hypothetical protein